nr:hypothetical protein [Tanacetum cinerariifolium]
DVFLLTSSSRSAHPACRGYSAFWVRSHGVARRRCAVASGGRGVTGARPGAARRAGVGGSSRRWPDGWRPRRDVLVHPDSSGTVS